MTTFIIELSKTIVIEVDDATGRESAIERALRRDCLGSDSQEWHDAEPTATIIDIQEGTRT